VRVEPLPANLQAEGHPRGGEAGQPRAAVARHQADDNRAGEDRIRGEAPDHPREEGEDVGEDEVQDVHQEQRRPEEEVTRLHLRAEAFYSGESACALLLRARYMCLILYKNISFA
jgi:hypothetical protein